MKAARTIALCALLLLAVAGADARKARKAFAPAPAPAPATAEDALLEGAAILRDALESGFELTPEELALLEAETAAAPAPAAEEIPARRLLHNGEDHGEAAAAPAPATEEALLEGDAIMRAVQEAGFELTPEELALLEAETAAAPAPATAEAEAGMMRRLLEEVAAAPAPATEEALLEGDAIMRAVQEAGFELTPEELALLEAETAAAPAPAAEEIPARRLLHNGEDHGEAAAAPAPATEEALLEGDAIMRAVQEAGFELTPEELALLEAETAAAPAPATADVEAGMMRRLLEEEVAAAPAPATEEALLEGDAIMRAVQEAGFELTPEELALLEAETAAAPAPAEAEAGMMRRLLEEEVAAAPAPATEEALLEGDAIMRAVQEAGFELTPEELALLEAETAAAPAPAEA